MTDPRPAANMPDHSKLEEEELLKVLNLSKLTLHDITPDGHWCVSTLLITLVSLRSLFNSIAHQLRLTGSITYTYQQLRKMCAEYMRKNADDFLPFLLTDGGDLYTPEAYEKYCDELEAKAVWGGHLEVIVAFSVGGPSFLADSSPLKGIETTDPSHSSQDYHFDYWRRIY